MLEKPNLPDELLIARLAEAYGLRAAGVDFLPLGADVNTAVYRVSAVDGSAYFLKLRKGGFAEITVRLPRYLNEQGVQAVIAPLAARDGALWAGLDPYKMILYPFVEGQNGYEVPLPDAQWVHFGAALRRIHALPLPPDLLRLLPRETYSPFWRDMVRDFQAQVELTANSPAFAAASAAAFTDPSAAKLAAAMRSWRGQIDHMLTRADQLAQELQARPLDFVCCHADLHPGNLLIGPRDFYIVDWDNPVLAPKERDLLLIGGTYAWNGAREKALFYQGYSGYSGPGGPVSSASASPEIDRPALAYYRYERIIQDIAAYCQQLFLSTEGGEDREQSIGYITSTFSPGHEVELAREADPLEG